MDLTNEDNLINEDELKKEYDLKNKNDLKDEDNLKNCPSTPQLTLKQKCYQVPKPEMINIT